MTLAILSFLDTLFVLSCPAPTPTNIFFTVQNLENADNYHKETIMYNPTLQKQKCVGLVELCTLVIPHPGG